MGYSGINEMYYKCLLLALLTPASAVGEALEKYPRKGFLTGETDRDYLKYQCDLAHDQKLACSFDRIKLMRKDAYLDKHKSEALIEFRTKIASDCSDAINGSADFAKRVSALPLAERQDLLKTHNALIKVCKNPHDGYILQLLEIASSKERATCTLDFHHFEQTFELKPNGTWTAVTEPGGICGIMHIASFEPSDYSWKYRSREIVTINYQNTDNKLLEVCNISDEKEYVFSTENAIFKDCRYIGWW